MKSVAMLRNIAIFLAFSSAMSAPTRAADSPEKAAGSRTRVVIQVSDDDAKKWNLALSNVKNLQQALGAGNVDIEVVAYGPGINMLKFESVVADRIDETLKAGVSVVACENTMHALKLNKSDMTASIGYVPAGVLEIIRKEHDGYAYIRP